MKVKKFLYSLILIVLIFNISSCNSNEKEKDEAIDEDILDPNSSLNTNFDGKIFSIPSPVQTSILIKDLKLPFTSSLLNPVENLSGYSTESKKALNLGIYGTDLGYLTLYNENASSLKYLNCIEKITKDLNLEDAFDDNFMERFEKNNTVQDSIVRLVSDAFKKADNFLKNNDRKNTSVLILIGGWIESLYLSCELNHLNNNKKIVERIGEQQQTLNTIIEILELYNKNSINDDLLNDLEDLKLTFDLIKIEYDFVPPLVNENKKLTTLQHSSEVKINSTILNLIMMKVNKLRTKIVE
jgi:hypothetical protein